MKFEILSKKIDSLSWHEAEGYDSNELLDIEKLFDININNDLKNFLEKYGKCSGGAIGDDSFIIYRDAKIRGHLLAQLDIIDSLQEIGEWDMVGSKPFLFAIQGETQYYFLPTNGASKDKVYIYDDNNESLSNTNSSFLETVDFFLDPLEDQNREVICKASVLDF